MIISLRHAVGVLMMLVLAPVAAVGQANLPLSQFADTPSTSLRGIIPDASGEGALLFGTNTKLKGTTVWKDDSDNDILAIGIGDLPNSSRMDLQGKTLFIENGRINGPELNMSVCEIQGYACVAATQAVSLNAVSDVRYGLKLFGDSITAGKGATVPETKGYAALLAASFPPSLTANYGVEGYSNADVQREMFDNLAPTEQGNPVVTLLVGANDVNSVGENATYRALYQRMLLASVARAALPDTWTIPGSSSQVVETGTWADDTLYANLTGNKSSTNGSLLAVNIVAPKGIIYVFYGAYASSGGTFRVLIDGVPAADQVTGNTTLTSQPAVAWLTIDGVTQGVQLARYIVPANDSFTVHVEVMSATNVGNPVTIYGFGVPGGNSKSRGISAPRVFVGGAIRQPDDVNSANTFILNAQNRAAATTLQDDGLNVNFVDIRAYLNPSIDMANVALQGCPAVYPTPTYYGHPNDCGYRHIAEAFEDAINPNRTTSLAPRSMFGSSAVPTTSGCGSGYAFSSNSSNLAGNITFGTGTGTPSFCNITFADANPNTTYCVLTPANSTAAGSSAYISGRSASAINISTASGNIDGASFNYSCVGG
jgi:lysophospholipase L1-like esterase